MKYKTFERNVEIFKLVALGATLQDAGDSAGISRERVRQIVARMCERLLFLFGRNFWQPSKKRTDIYSVRQNAAHWLKLLAKWQGMCDEKGSDKRNVKG